jgi:FlaG protein.
MDSIMLTGHSGPAAVQSGGTIAGISRSVSEVPNVRRSVRAMEPGSERQDGLSAEEIQRRAVEMVRAAVDEAGAAIDQGSRLVIRKDEETGRFIYEFRNPHTNELVRQFPAEEVLKALASFRQAATGQIMDRQV